ncbi:hypothetical protein GGF46_003227 [Coemansia sp. RSA 552]|nr:hypothetical protein GGF46_003227 [Coemansia sp. RSA 552]
MKGKRGETDRTQSDFYGRVGKILQQLGRREGTIKSLTIGNSAVKPEHKRKVYALLCQTLKYAPVLMQVLERTDLLQHESQLRQEEALLMVHDLLLTKAGLQRVGASPSANSAVKRHAGSLATALDEIRREAGASTNADLIPAHLNDGASTFRYVRVNQLATTMEAAIRKFRKEGYQLVEAERGDETRNALAAGSRQFMRDPDLDDLLVFPPGTDMHAHPLYVDGSVVLQDKASCMPAHVARPTPGSAALDACAAPGNKTSHLAALMGNQGRIFAFDRNRGRLDTLEELTRRAGCKTITAQCTSFLEVDPLDPEYADVECAVVDPSCSGSGIVGRADALVDAYVVATGGRARSGADGGRLQALADFQTAAVLHAMRFPSVQRVVYSTCSVHEEEDEAVVAHVLATQPEFALMPADHVVPTWPRRGLVTCGLSADQAACLVRARPEDGTNGFFVAGFVRQAPADLDRTRQEFAAFQQEQAPATAGDEPDPEAPSKRQKRGGRGRNKAAADKRRQDQPGGPDQDPKAGEGPASTAPASAPAPAPRARANKKRSRRKSAIVA